MELWFITRRYQINLIQVSVCVCVCTRASVCACVETTSIFSVSALDRPDMTSIERLNKFIELTETAVKLFQENRFFYQTVSISVCV